MENKKFKYYLQAFINVIILLVFIYLVALFLWWFSPKIFKLFEGVDVCQSQEYYYVRGKRGGCKQCSCRSGNCHYVSRYYCN